jgi:hypothetical protein
MPDREALADYAAELAKCLDEKDRLDQGPTLHSDPQRRADYSLVLNRQINELHDKIRAAAHEDARAD